MTDDVTAAGPPRLPHVPALDGLRGVAVLAVVAFHLDRLTGGYLGVDLFFVLSGYLITSLLVVEWAATGRIDLRTFYWRRIRRLLPALLVVLTAVGLLAQTEVMATARDELRVAAVATLAYVANWVEIYAGDGYWGRTALPSWLAHTWSLAIEEQFYVVWPLVVMGVGKLVRSRRAWARSATGNPTATAEGVSAPPAEVTDRLIRLLGRLAAAGAALSGSGAVAWAWAGGDTQRIYLGTDTRAAALLLGCWAACRRQLEVRRDVPSPLGFGGPSRRVLTALGAVGAAGLVVAWIGLDGTSPVLYRGGLLACGLAATAVILDIATPGPSLVRAALEAAPLRGAGAISYGLYLWHWPVIQYLHLGRWGLDGWGLDAVRVGVSLALAVVSYVVVEQPIRQQRWSVARPGLVPAAVALCVVVLWWGTSGGYDVQLGVGHERATAVGAPERTDPSDGEGPSGAGEPDGPAGPPSVLVVGDSVAYLLAEDGLAPQAEALGLVVTDRAVIGCRMMPRAGDPPEGPKEDCRPTFPEAVDEARPDVVLMLFGAFAALEAGSLDGQAVWPCEPAWDEHWKEQVDEAVDLLSADGATVVLATAPTAALRPFKGDDPGRFDRRQECANETLREVAAARPEAVLYDLALEICPDGTVCTKHLDGAELRPDALHFSGEGALAMARRMGPVLREAARS